MGLRDWWDSLKPKHDPKPPVAISISTFIQEEDPQLTQARHEATAHGKNCDYPAAVAALERVHELESEGGTEPQCGSEIRRAKYLQKAGRGDEAWQLFLKLLDRHHANPWLLVDLLNAMRLHLQREGTAKEAIAYGIAMRLAQITHYRKWKAEAEAALASPVQSYGDDNFEKLIRKNQHRDIEICSRWLGTFTDDVEHQGLVRPLCKKAGVPEQTDEMIAELKLEIERQTDPLAYLKSKRVQ